jgi:hypothetical protein
MIIFWVLWAFALSLLIYADLIYRFLHPSLTETQLLLSNWWMYLLGILCLGIGCIIASFKR